MRPNTIYYSIITLIIFGAVILSCNTAKTVSAVSNTLYITLEDNLTGKYISKTYSDYTPTDVAKSNKTLNTYRAKFNCSASKFATLMSMLEKDKKVATVKESKTTNNQKQASKNINHSKTKSIRKNN